MTIAIVSVDRDTHPAALLPLVKSHCRIDGTYDDAYVTSVIGRAIAKIEAANGAAINPTVITWSPRSDEWCEGRATLPVSPATSFTAAAGSPGGDVTADYAIELKWDGIHGIPIQVLTGAGAGGLVVTLTLGFTDLADAPELLDRVLRHSAHLYEHREILTDGAPYVAPDLALDATWWMPKV